jgi:hypothetical protein
MKTKPPPAPQEFSMTQAAQHLGCGKSSVQRRVIELELGRFIGTQKVLTLAEVELIGKHVRKKKGNPEFGIKYKGAPQPKKKGKKATT